MPGVKLLFQLDPGGQAEPLPVGEEVRLLPGFSVPRPVRPLEAEQARTVLFGADRQDVPLADVAAAVPGPDQLGNPGPRQHDAAGVEKGDGEIHVVVGDHAPFARQPPGQHRGARRGADRRRTEGLVENQGLRGKPVDVGGGAVDGAVGPQRRRCCSSVPIQRTLGRGRFIGEDPLRKACGRGAAAQIPDRWTGGRSTGSPGAAAARDPGACPVCPPVSQEPVHGDPPFPGSRGGAVPAGPLRDATGTAGMAHINTPSGPAPSSSSARAASASASRASPQAGRSGGS